MSDESFLRYLLSFDNFIVDPAKFDLFMDMDKPLTHYFIASSHNTYLTGRSFSVVFVLSDDVALFLSSRLAADRTRQYGNVSTSLVNRLPMHRVGRRRVREANGRTGN